MNDVLSSFNDPVFVTEKLLKIITLAEKKHEKRNDRHIFQFKLVPKENILKDRYYENRCYSKFT